MQLSRWPIGVFASIDAGLGVRLDVARELGVPYEPDLAKALAREDVTLVSICAEPERRGRIAVQCAQAGKHLYLDKSLVPQLREADPCVVVIFGATGANSPSAQQPRLLASLLGYKMKVIAGYKGTAEVRVAMEKGEAEAVCAFVNDDLGEPVLQELARLGVRLVALRCAGFNNIDLEAACNLGIRVARVPAYSPYAVAEHTAALILALNRKIHRAHNRVREGNFALEGLLGFDLHGKTVGIVSGVLNLLVVVILYLMVAKPG